MKVVALKTYKVRETGKVVRPGQTLEYSEDRAKELAADGWVALSPVSGTAPAKKKPGPKPKNEK
jgi:hypothetical protein